MLGGPGGGHPARGQRDIHLTDLMGCCPGARLDRRPHVGRMRDGRSPLGGMENVPSTRGLLDGRLKAGVQGQIPQTGVQGHVVISRATHFPTCLGVVPGGCSFVGVLVSKSGNKSLFKSMNGLFHTLSHASPFDINKSNPSHASPLDIHNSNLHLPCTVPGTNLFVATKRGLEYPQHIAVSVQNVPREDDRDVRLRVDTKA